MATAAAAGGGSAAVAGAGVPSGKSLRGASADVVLCSLERLEEVVVAGTAGAGAGAGAIDSADIRLARSVRWSQASLNFFLFFLLLRQNTERE